METLEVKRFLEDDTVIEFTDPVFAGNNVEVSINHNEKHKMWLSQLKGFYADTEKEDPQFCTITFKHHGTIECYLMDNKTFWELVKGKRFRVSVEFYYKISWRENRHATLFFYQRACLRLRKYLLEYNMKAARFMGTNSPKYDLVEI